MMCISLWQPWAALVVIGAKRIETRHWSTHRRGPLGIHAAKIQRSRKDGFDVDEVFERPVFKLALQAAGFRDAKDLAYGALLGGTELVACKQIVSSPIRTDSLFGTQLDEDRQMIAPPPPELAFGNYTTGRCAWILAAPKRLPDPIPMTGRQGFWDIDDALLARAA